jgi:hypothetical protein
MAEPNPNRDSLTTWRAKLDWWVKVAGILVVNAGLAAQAAGFTLAFLGGDPIAGDAWLGRGFWLAGLGGAGLAYAIQVDAGGSVKQRGGTLTYEPPERRWPAALWSIVGTPVWAVLSLPLGILLYGILAVGLLVFGCLGLVRLIRPTRTG